jgi:uncharacterized delta-60 repeat protein
MTGSSIDAVHKSSRHEQTARSIEAIIDAAIFRPVGVNTIARWTVVLSLAMSVCAQAARADGQLDPSFGSGGRVDLSLVNSSGTEGAVSVLQRGDGRFITVGAGEGKGIWVTQDLANGALDGGFGTTSGTYFLQSRYSSASAAVREPNGSIVLAGGEESISPGFDTLIARLTPQGALDPSFGNDPPNPTGDGISVFDLGGDDLAEGIAIDSNGRIIIAGRTGSTSSHDVLLARFNSDGSIDAGFGGPTGVHTDLGGNDIGTNVATQGERIVVLANSGPNTDVLGYRPNGTLDPAFGGGDGIAPVNFPAGTESNALLIQPDGRIVVAGSHSTNAYIARLQPDGSQDTSFGSGGVTSFEAPSGATGMYLATLAQSDDSKTVAAATSFAPGNNHAVLLRTLANGQPDPAWGTNGVLTIPSPPETSDYAFAVSVEPDRRILVGGDTYANGNDDRLLLRVLGDTTPPDTAITHAPKQKRRLSRHPVMIAFEAVGDVHTTFECELIRPRRKHRHRRPAQSAASSPTVAFSACASPVTYRNLRMPGRYSFAVRAIDPAGNVDPTPATVTVKVLPKRRHKRHRH